MSEETPDFHKPTPKEEPPIRYRDPPVRDSAPLSSGLVGAIGIIALIAVLVLANGGFNKGKPAANDRSLPKVSISDAKPCVRNNDPTIQLNSESRLAACKKAKQYAKAKLAKQYSGAQLKKQFKCLDELWIHESEWSAWAENSSSKAYGIPQSLGHGHVYDMGDWKAQVDWGLKYIKGRYGAPCDAWAFWQRTDPRPHPGNWY